MITWWITTLIIYRSLKLRNLRWRKIVLSVWPSINRSIKIATNQILTWYDHERREWSRVSTRYNMADSGTTRGMPFSYFPCDHVFWISIFESDRVSRYYTGISRFGPTSDLVINGLRSSSWTEPIFALVVGYRRVVPFSICTSFVSYRITFWPRHVERKLDVSEYHRSDRCLGASKAPPRIDGDSLPQYFHIPAV